MKALLLIIALTTLLLAKSTSSGGFRILKEKELIKIKQLSFLIPSLSHFGFKNSTISFLVVM